MLSDKLKLNSDKTEFLIIGTKHQLEKVSVIQLQVGNSLIDQSSTAVRNLGAWNLSLYNIRRIRKYLTRATTESLVHAFITSKLDYCNSLLYGLPDNHIAKLQRVQNA